MRLPYSIGAAVLASITLLLGTPVTAWHSVGHSAIAAGAVRALPSEVPAYFRAGSGTVAHLAVDPDAFKNRKLSLLRSCEGPEHYIDLELLEGKELPGTRYAFLKLCFKQDLDPEHVGTVPYAIAEWTERLTMAFAEHRKWPQNPHIRAKSLVYAGILAHYSGDLCQPLHTTVHHDGRAGADHKSPRSGIHARVDSLVDRLGFKPQALAAGQKVESLPALFPGILGELHATRRRIDRVYELENQLPAGRNWKPSAEVRAFTLERAKAAVRFTASLYLTAWRDSARVALPGWLERDPAPAPAATKSLPKPAGKQTAPKKATPKKPRPEKPRP